MLGIFSILAAEVLFSFIVLIWKDLRKKGVSPLGNLSIFIFSVPIFIVLWFVLGGSDKFNFSPIYFLYLLLWLIPVFAYNVGNTYLIKYQGLLELNTYKLGFSTVIAIGADILFLNTRYSLHTIVSLLLFFLGGYLLTSNRLKPSVPFSVSAIILFLLSLLQVFEYAVYKKAMLLQNSILLHVFLAQSVMSVAFFLCGYFPLMKGIRDRIIRPWHIVTITTLFCFFVVLESIGLSQLPIAIVILAAIFPILIYSVYDAKTAEVKVSFQSVAAFCAVVLGVLLLSL